MESGVAKRSQEKQARTRRSQEEPGGAKRTRRNQEEPGGLRKSQEAQVLSGQCGQAQEITPFALPQGGGIESQPLAQGFSFEVPLCMLVEGNFFFFADPPQGPGRFFFG